MIDTHCHLDDAKYDHDRDAVAARALAAGVTGVLVPAIRPRTWGALRAMTTRLSPVGVRCAMGIHPQVVPELGEDEIGGDLEARIAEAGAHAAAIGECGLDGETGEQELQERIFRAHVRVARSLGVPLVVHVLHAHDAAPRILREEKTAGGVLHSYSGSAELVPVYRDLGFAFSFAGPVTYENARRPIEAARAVPAELLLAETDGPDQAPVPYRGGRSEPAHLPAVIAGLAAARETTPAEINALTSANAIRVFRCWK